MSARNIYWDLGICFCRIHHHIHWHNVLWRFTRAQEGAVWDADADWKSICGEDSRAEEHQKSNAQTQREASVIARTWCCGQAWSLLDPYLTVSWQEKCSAHYIRTGSFLGLEIISFCLGPNFTFRSGGVWIGTKIKILVFKTSNALQLFILWNAFFAGWLCSADVGDANEHFHRSHPSCRVFT